MIILGLMSGTSLDGIDLALCDMYDGGYRVLAAATVPYTAEWRRRLAALDSATALEYALANVELGHHMGRVVAQFLADKGVRPEAVASHGHTVFHQPQRGMTAQIGDGDAIAAECGLPVVSNFRTLDVALGGQGAPLVPIGDRLLFGQYAACLNLGGIANISYERSEVGGRRSELSCCAKTPSSSEPNSNRVAFDICPCNMLLNRLVASIGLDYDPDGMHASRGAVDRQLLALMESMAYYRQPAPKSLGKEWFDAEMWPLVQGQLDGRQETVERLLRTAVEHIASQIALTVNGIGAESLLVTGGGAHNRFLIARLRELCPGCTVTVPDPLTVDYKEAIIFALLGYLRITGRTNTLRSVTGARCDSIGGTLSGIF